MITAFFNAVPRGPPNPSNRRDLSQLNSRDFYELTNSAPKCLKLCQDYGLIPTARSCPKCGGKMKIHTENTAADGKRWRCATPQTHRDGGKECRASLNIRSGTFFEGMKLSIQQALSQIWSWACRHPRQEGLDNARAVGAHTGVDWYGYCREIAMAALQNDPDLDRAVEGRKIGGPGIIVEVDESKYGKRKNSRGRRVEGQWVVGGIERDNISNMFLVPVKKRDAETLIFCIWQNIAPGSIILSDCWKGYVTKWLEDLGYEHRTVNHSKHFVDPVTGHHTQNIECNCCQSKGIMPRRGTSKTLFQGYLWEFMWRRKYLPRERQVGGPAFAKIIEHIANFHGSPITYEAIGGRLSDLSEPLLDQLDANLAPGYNSSDGEDSADEAYDGTWGVGDA